MSPAAKKYLDYAIETIQREAMNSDKVDWKKLRAEAYLEAKGAELPVDTYPAIRLVLAGLGDHHSFLQLDQEHADAELRRREKLGLGPLPKRPPGSVYSELRKRRMAGLDLFPTGNDQMIARIVVPLAFTVETLSLLPERLRTLLRGTDKSCGLIVDLRGNGGGNMWPMLLGLEPLFVEGTIGYGTVVRGEKRGRFDWTVSSRQSGITKAGKFEMVAQVGPNTNCPA